MGMRLGERFSALRRWVGGPLERLLTGRGHIVQKAVAAGLAWWLATILLGHTRPAFAAIAAIIATGAADGREGRQVLDLVFGVTCGLLVSNLLVSTLGIGVLQIGAVVGLATAVALLFGRGELLVNEAAISALLVIVLVPASGSTMPLDRFLDGLLGCVVALTLHLLFPENPRRDLQQAARPIFTGLSAVLRDIAAATRNGDAARAEAALRKARELDGRVSELKGILDASHAPFRFFPARKRAGGHIGLYSTAAGHLDLAVRNTRVLARAAVSLLGNGNTAPDMLPETILELSMAVEALDEYVEEPDHPVHTRYLALTAAEGATSVLDEQNDLDTNMLVGQVRCMAVDLLQASGMDPETALSAFHEAAGHASGDTRASSNE